MHLPALIGALSITTWGTQARINLLWWLYKLDASKRISRGGILVRLQYWFTVTYKLMISLVHLKGLFAVHPLSLLYIAPLWVHH